MIILDVGNIAAVMGGKVTGRDSVNVPGPGHNPHDLSLSIKLSARAPGGFIVFSHAGDDPIQCRDYVRERLGMEPFKNGQPRPLVSINLAKPKPGPQGDWALKIWQQAVDPRGTIVERYLRDDRGLVLAPEMAGSVVRFHGSLKYDDRRLPGMVCLMRHILTDEPVGIHRTFLERSSGHKVDRRMLGPSKSAAIKIDHRPSIDGRLTIGEGFETCLAARHADLGPVWALGSAGGIGAFPVIRGLTELTLLKEIDPTSDLKTNQCAQRYLRARRRVHVVTPNVGKDFNDVWRMSQV